MKKPLQLTFLFLFVVCIGTLFSFTAKDIAEGGRSVVSDSLPGKLPVYGLHIFERENCSKCHTLIVNEDPTKISLDGLKGKYPLSWHYNHLMDPAMMVIDSKMPKFPQLETRDFNRDSIEEYSGKISDQEWNALNDESQKIVQQLVDFNISLGKNSEMLALLSFLDNIPVSAAFKETLQEEAEKYKREMAIQDSIWATGENRIARAISDPGSVHLGQAIFMNHCTPCHGMNGAGMIGPNLTDEYWLHGAGDLNLVTTIKEGVCKYPRNPDNLKVEKKSLTLNYHYEKKPVYRNPNHRHAQGA